MRRGAVIVLWFLAVVATLFFIALVVAPWLGLLGVVTVPRLHFDSARTSLTAVDAATLTVGGSTGLLALIIALQAAYTRRSVAEAQREARVVEEALRATQDNVKVGLQQVTVGQQQVEASNKQSAVVQRALEATLRPLMADVPRGFRTYPDSGRQVEVVREQFERVEDESQVLAGAEYGRPGYFSVALRNIGTGPAVVTGVKLRAEEVTWDECTISAAFVAPGELSRFTFTIPADRDDLVPIRNEILRSTTMLVVVTYTDQVSLHQLRTEARLSRYRHAGGVSPWYVRQLATFDGDTEQPIVTSAPTDPYGIPR